MKRLLSIGLITFFLLTGIAHAGIEGATSSGEKTTSGQIVTGNCYLTAVTVITDGTNDATVTLYDNTAASGRKVAEFVIPGGDRQGGRNWVYPVFCYAGIYAEISGTGASCIVEYTKR